MNKEYIFGFNKFKVDNIRTSERLFKITFILCLLNICFNYKFILLFL